MIEKPPVGVKPKWMLDEERIYELFDAIMRYKKSGAAIPFEWIDELTNLLLDLKHIYSTANENKKP